MLDDPLLVAGVQKGNVGSMAVVKSRSKEIVGPIQSCLVKTVNKQSQTSSTLAVR